MEDCWGPQDLEKTTDQKLKNKVNTSIKGRPAEQPQGAF